MSSLDLRFSTNMLVPRPLEVGKSYKSLSLSYSSNSFYSMLCTLQIPIIA
jgi:hypothetical protein